MRWSSSAALIGVVLPASACAKRRPVEIVAERLQARDARAADGAAARRRCDVVEHAEAARVVEAQHGAVIEGEDDMIVRFGAARLRLPDTTMRPDMPRCTISTPPSSRWIRMYLARRPRRADTRGPRARAAQARRQRRAQIGAVELERGDPTARPCAAPGRAARSRLRAIRACGSGWRFQGLPRYVPAHERAARQAARRDFGYRRVNAEEKARLVRAGLRQRRRPLRPDERSDERRHPPPVEGAS